MKLCQGQTWKQGEEFIRITRLERLSVEFKTMPDLISRQGSLQTRTKKEFCRLIKGAQLLNLQEVAAARDVNPEMLTPEELEQNKVIS